MIPLLPSSIDGYRPAPFTPGTYRVRGNKSHRQYPTREILHQKSSSFFVELDFAGNGGFAACISASQRSSSHRSELTSGGESRSNNEGTFDQGLIGTWRRNGNLAIAEVSALRDTCDSEAKPSSNVVIFTCAGLIATTGKHRLVKCALTGDWADTLRDYIAPWEGDDDTPWFLAGNQHGLEVSVTSRDGVAELVTIEAASSPLSRPVRPHAQ